MTTRLENLENLQICQKHLALSAMRYVLRDSFCITESRYTLVIISRH